MLKVVKPEQGGLQALACNCHNKDIHISRVIMKKKIGGRGNRADFVSNVGMKELFGTFKQG